MGARILVMGITFKQNCPDIRNTKVADLVPSSAPGPHVTVYDPLADRRGREHEYNINAGTLAGASFDAVVLAVRHDEISPDRSRDPRPADPERADLRYQGALPTEASHARL